MGGMELLHKATKSRKYKVMVDNAMHGVFGETDEGTRTIKINKKLHAVKGGGHLIKNKDGTEKIIGTLTHELMHATHPKMLEKTVRKLSKMRLKTMSPKRKDKLYAALDHGGMITA